MSKIDTGREAIAALLDGVTEGPWLTRKGDFDEGFEVFPTRPSEPKPRVGSWVEVAAVPETGREGEAKANSDFIAFARELVPALAAERDAAVARAEDLAVAIMGGEDAPGFSTSVGTDQLCDMIASLRRERDDAEARAEAAEAERDRQRDYLLETSGRLHQLAGDYSGLSPSDMRRLANDMRHKADAAARSGEGR